MQTVQNSHGTTNNAYRRKILAETADVTGSCGLDGGHDAAGRITITLGNLEGQRETDPMRRRLCLELTEAEAERLAAYLAEKLATIADMRARELVRVRGGAAAARVPWAAPGSARQDARVTITAAEVPGACSCYRCGATEPRRKLYGLTADNVTTSDAAAVVRWVCLDCFADPARAR